MIVLFDLWAVAWFTCLLIVLIFAVDLLYCIWLLWRLN